MSSFSRLLAYARPYRGRLVAAVAAMLCYAAASAGLVTLIKPLMDSILSDRLDLTFWGIPVDLQRVERGGPRRVPLQGARRVLLEPT